MGKQVLIGPHLIDGDPKRKNITLKTIVGILIQRRVHIEKRANKYCFLEIILILSG